MDNDWTNCHRVYRFHQKLVLAALAMCLLSGRLPAAETVTPFQRAQETKRQAREQVLASYTKDREKAQSRGLEKLEEYFLWCVKNGHAAAAREDLLRVHRAYPKHLFSKELAPIATPGEVDAKEEAAVRSHRDTAMQAYSSSLLALAKACFSVRMYACTFELLNEILTVNPDDRLARSYLGYVPIVDSKTQARRWYLQSEAEHLRRGEEYVDDVGWVPRTAAERCRKGEYFENGQFVSQAEADKAHADLKNMWVLPGPHFTLHTTMDRSSALKVAAALEEFYRIAHSDYLGLWEQNAASLNQLFDTRAGTETLHIYFFATKDQYAEYLSRPPFKQEEMKLMVASQGFYNPATHASYFWRTKRLADDLGVAFHETTHQIVGESLAVGQPPDWLAEMSAVYMERVRWVDDRCLAPAWALSNLRRSVQLDPKSMEVAAFTGLTRKEFHTEDAVKRNFHYALAGGLADFLMNGDNGVYRQGYMEFLRDSYTKKEVAPLHAYLGLSSADLETRWQAYHQATFVGLMKRLNIKLR